MERQASIVEEFGMEASRLRLLLASDVASEGINLHYLCHRLIHFDIPWSLMTFQQRNGRIDRYGQTSPPLIAYLQIRSANERIRGDLRILELLRQKDEEATNNIGDPSVFLGLYSQEEEERWTGEMIASGKTAEEAEKEMAADTDWFEALLTGAREEEAADPAPETAPPLSLYRDDLATPRPPQPHSLSGPHPEGDRSAKGVLEFAAPQS